MINYMTTNVIFILIGMFLFIIAWLLKICLYEKSGELYKYNDHWVFNFKRVNFPVWEMILVAIACSLPIINIVIFTCQLVYILNNIEDGTYKFSIINIEGIPNDEDTLNKIKEDWKNLHKFKYSIYKFIKLIFTFNLN